MPHASTTQQFEQEATPVASGQAYLPLSGSIPSPVVWQPVGAVRLVDQTRLPSYLEYVDCRTIEELADAIRKLKVRGAPVIGVAAAYGLALAAHLSPATQPDHLLADLASAASTLRATRPTAVNLAWALGYVTERAQAAAAGGVEAVRGAVLDAARQIEMENDRASLLVGQHGATLFNDSDNILTHCNTGPLAAGGVGTALGAIYTAHKQGKRVHVWVDETRPLLQGARLTAWELKQWGIPYTLIADNMAASLMRAGRVQAVILGADRIAANGDVANKIGTYGLAVLARAHALPFYVAAPCSTIDFGTPNGEAIKIEERAAHEVTHHAGTLMAPEGATVYNPAFDVTPASLVSCIITESGIARAPLTEDAVRKVGAQETAAA